MLSDPSTESRHRHDAMDGRMTKIDWKGSTLEELDLLAAVQHNCTCSFDCLGACLSICPGHSMLVNDQRALDGLLLHRHLRNLLLAEEGIVPH